jgi:NADH:ubiquinone oxidoreductase subunit 5 (subunit L)/multisubunit Na+/H+ antiporter MnhA subunit
MTVAAAALTSFYSWRLIFKTFHGTPHDQHHCDAARESPKAMLIPLAVLAFGSLAAGWPLLGLFTGEGALGFFRESLKYAPGNTVLEDMEHLPLEIALAPTAMMIIGFLVAYQFYIRRPDIPVALARDQAVLYRFLLNKWYFDEIYDFLFVRPAIWIGRTASCSTSGTSTKSTTFCSCVPPSGSAGCSGRAVTASSLTASGLTASRRACSTLRATSSACRPAISIPTRSRC